VPRLYHSASSLALGDRCKRAWFYQYVAGIREPRVLWRDIAHYVADRDGKTWRDPNDATKFVPSRARSTALGTEMHKRHEARYLGAPVDWHDVPGAIALSGLHFLPQPDRARVKVEAPIGTAAIVGAAESHAPPVGFRVAGILWAGYRDLVAYAPEEWTRLGVQAAHGWALVDYKSSADIARYALTPEELRTDFAANLYALATMAEHEIDTIAARWVYFETKRRRYAEPRDAAISKLDAFETVAAGSERARALDAITTEASAVQNTNACEEYGGCPHHHSRGGPCDARRSLLSLLPLRVPKKEGSNTMALPAGITQFKPPSPANGAGPGATFTPPPQGGFAPPPHEHMPVADPVADVAPPPPAEPTKSRKKPAAAAPPPAAPVTIAAPLASTGELYDFEIDGNYGPLTLRGDARDVIMAAKMLRAGSAQ